MAPSSSSTTCRNVAGYHRPVTLLLLLLLLPLAASLTRPLALRPAVSSRTSRTALRANKQQTGDLDVLSFFDEDAVSDFCEGTNDFWRQLVFPPIRDAVATRPGGTADDDILGTLFATPETPGVPRPVWLTMLGSVPTGLVWYGYYKFCVEEELFQWEKKRGEKLTGCGGYGTLFPFVFGILIGGPLSLIHFPGGEQVVSAAGAWILLGQANLYRRVNALCAEGKVVGRPGASGREYAEPPLHVWWAFLPPPLDVVVGLRQVHFLAEYWKEQRRQSGGVGNLFGAFSGAGMKGANADDEGNGDVVALDLFPFISAPRFTLREFFRTPSLWFWFTKDWKDLDFEILRD
jgi:hypothetical protein